MNSSPEPDAPMWTSNTTLQDLALWLRSRKRIVILTHVKPDGDAVGSTIAVARALNLATGAGGMHRPATATPWFWGPLPDWFRDVVGPTETRFIDEQNKADHDAREEPDGILILDTGSWSQLHEVREWLLPRTAHAAVLDHHRQGDGDVAAKKIILTDAAAVCEPAAELCRQLLGLKAVRDLPAEVAEPLYMGLATDTGWFRHSNVTPAVMRTGAELLEAGANHSRLYELLEQRDRTSRLRLMARALASLELHKQDSIAVLTLTQQDFHDCRATPTDSGGFSELALTAASVQVCVLITEAWVNEQQNITKISFRSKEGPDAVDVNEAARRLGGGGHMRAAGAKVSVPVAEAKRLVLEALK
jgi:bifunctional oligoribonuclease and PAP phosphatase NrnA